jgi:uncharacterized Zn ribbon protein
MYAKSWLLDNNQIKRFVQGLIRNLKSFFKSRDPGGALVEGYRVLKIKPLKVKGAQTLSHGAILSPY